MDTALEQRVAMLEVVMAQTAGEIAGLVQVLYAVIGEPDLYKRMSLLDQRRKIGDATLLGTAITDELLDHVEQGQARIAGALDAAFLRSVAPPAVRDRAGLE